MNRTGEILSRALGIVFVIVVRSLPIFAAKPEIKAQIGDVFAFRSYDGDALSRVTLILCVDPSDEPANGPTWWPFDPDILYEIKIDNNDDAVEDIVFQFRFTTEQRLPNAFQSYLGSATGVRAPANSPPPVAPGTLIIPPRITSFDSLGLGQRQSYTVTMIKGENAASITGPGPFYAVPSNVGPRSMDYQALFAEATYATSLPNVRVFAGTVDDPFWADLGALYDTLNFRSTIDSGVLSTVEDHVEWNFASDSRSGYSVNAIAIELPVSMLTRTGAVEPPSSASATIGIWGTISTVAAKSSTQAQRMGNPLINDLMIGNGFKTQFSQSPPLNDAQFAAFFLDPTLARMLNAKSEGALSIPTPPRIDLLPLITYAPPVAAPGTPSGPVADVLRLNTGVPPTPVGHASRMGVLGGDPAGYPNGRRLFDDVTDIFLRIIAGAFNPASNHTPNNRLGDGVNVNDADYRTSFPYLADAPSGRDRRHIDPGEHGCTAGNLIRCP